MKFVCDRCLTKYSIADDKVRGRILKIRCKSCSNIITVKESAPAPAAPMVGDSDRTVITSGPHGFRPSPLPPARTVRPPTPPPLAGAKLADDVQWFLAIEGVRTGPFSKKALVDKLAGLAKNADVHIWNDTLSGWKAPEEIPIIARELQDRHRAAPPGPPPPPVARLRPVPAPPSQRAPNHPRGVTAPLGSHMTPAGISPHSSLGLGAASAALMPAAAHAAVAESLPVTDTPAPMRELVQAHKAQNGIDAHRPSSLGAASSPSVALANGESDALQALNLGGGWRQPGAPETSAEWGHSSAAVASATGVRLRQRNLKLIYGVAGIVGVCVIVLVVALRKPPPPAAAASPNGMGTAAERSAPGTPGQGTGLGLGLGKEGKEGPQAKGQLGKEGKEGPGTDPQPTESAGNPEPSGAGTAGKPESVARINPGKKPQRPNPGRSPPFRGGAGTAPGPAVAGGAALTPEQQAAASRFGDTSTKSLQLRNSGPTAPKVTPAQGDITRVVNNNKGGIKVCYQRALLRDNSLTHGKIDVRVSIGISGRVKNVGIDGPSSFRALDPCIKDVLSRWVFPASSEEYGTEFSYLFQGNE